MRRGIWTFLVTGVAVFMVAMDNLVVTNALPVIRVALGTGLEGLEWTVNAYTLTFAVFLLTGAALGDRFGRRRLLAAGLAVFTAASAAAAMAPSIAVLVTARAVQGLAGAVVLPLTLTLLASAVPPARRGLAFGLWGAMSGLGVALGPVIGGAITQYASWQWIFWINVPVGIALLPLVALVRESRGGAGRLDLLGTALVTAGLFGVTYGLVRGNGQGWTSAEVLGALVGGGVLLLAFVVWQARARTPMVPLGLFASRGFALSNVISMMMAFGMFGAVFLLAQFLQTVQHYSPLEAGVRTLPWTAMPAVAAPIAGALSDRIGGRWIVAVGLALQAIGIGWLAMVTEPSVPYSSFVGPFVLAGTGMGLFFAPITRLVLGFAPAHLEGVASGTSTAMRQLGTVLGVAVLGAIFAANGGYASGQQFVAGSVPAATVGAIALGAAALLALAIPAAVGGSARRGQPTAEPAAEPATEAAAVEAVPALAG
jgi:EmrB/QacA subfamily drug resistance transporter